MGFGGSLTGGFGRNGSGAGGAKEEIIAIIRDFKNAPEIGKKRIVVTDQKKRRSDDVIDIDIKHSHDLEKKGTYKFQVSPKAETHNGHSGRTMKHGFKSYSCSEKPEVFDAEAAHAEPFNRFGNGSNMKSRTRMTYSA